MSTRSSPRKTRGTNAKRVAKVIIDTSNDAGKPSRLELRDVPVPVTFDYLVAQMRQKGFPEPTSFSARKQVRLEVVDGPSTFDVKTLAGCINRDEPLCKYYHNHLRDVIKMRDRKPEAHADLGAAPGLSHAKIHGEDVDVGGVSMSFMRTLRVPDDGKEHSLPAGLGQFPLLNAAEFAPHLPPSIARKGGILMGMHQCEAMWIGFHGHEGNRSYAVKVSAGGVNAITGTPRSSRTSTKQDYLAVTSGYGGQTWLDGFSTERGVVRQFVAVPTGEGLTVEAQITGKEDVGGIQIDVFPVYDAPASFYSVAGAGLDRYYSAESQGVSVGRSIVCADEDSGPSLDPRRPELPNTGPAVHLTAIGESFNIKMASVTLYIKALTGKRLMIQVDGMDTIKHIKTHVQAKEGIPVDHQRLIFAGLTLEDNKRLCDYPIQDEATLHLVLRLVGGGGGFEVRSFGFAAGGKISQKIVRDRLPAAAYNLDAGCRLHITVLSPAFLAQLTGHPSISTPISVKTYLKADLPWFDIYDEGLPSANNVSKDHPLAAVQSLQHMLAERRDADPTRHRCCYCATTASFELRPCGHRICQDCADGLRANECPKRCRNVTGRKTLLSEALAESEAGWDCPAAGTADERVIVLERCAADGFVGTFIRSVDNVSRLSSDA